ncbi:sulfurtransferase [Sabulilitoribacter arenilitoris]|uniref:Sulfurtransferase n=1 Tax=Wocania arenilitoris TaxID=2044858 RepID=A0AAE3JML9_9FLAO|nr:sulfurtransferase [Wocania arenilitoris]MCF7569467.1 sulfurtransferase [Wocania arenilitoris]
MNSEILISQPIVSVEWLHKNLNAKNLVILDGTIAKTFDVNYSQIPNTRFFDTKQKFSDVSNPFPSAFPSAQQFQKEARNLGINSNSVIVVYDDKGIYSSPRVWWLFKAFGYNNVAVLNGGFPAWIKAEYPTEPMQNYSGKAGDFVAKLQPKFMQFFKDVVEASKNKTHCIIYARSSARFNCLEPEPRAGLRSGTIPNSKNIPFKTLLNNAGLLKSKEKLKTIFSELISEDDAVIFSCGSGITACVLALGAEISGYKNIAVYDGSWTEWGSLVKA